MSCRTAALIDQCRHAGLHNHVGIHAEAAGYAIDMHAYRSAPATPACGTSITSLWSAGCLCGCDLAVTNGDVLMPSMPEARQIRGRRRLSKVALIDMNNLPCLRRRRYPALARIRSILRILQEQTSCHDLAVAKPIESSYSR
jgi:hypothetical protein